MRFAWQFRLSKNRAACKQCNSIGTRLMKKRLLSSSALLPSSPLLTRRRIRPPATVTLDDFKLVGDLSGDQAAFTLTATARVESSKGGSLDLLSGAVALTEAPTQPQWRIQVQQNRFVAVFDHGGKFPIKIKFNAAVRQNEPWKAVDFHVAPSVLQPIVLQGLGADTQFEFAGAARPERKGSDFISYLPSDGTVKLSWKEARPEAEGKLFYAAEMLSQISVSPGLMRQVALLDFKVMQGELNRVALLLRGAGEVTRVQGDQVLAWNVEPVPHGTFARPTDRARSCPVQPAAEGPVRPPGADADAAGRVPAGGGCGAVAARGRDALCRLLPHRERRGGAARSRAGQRAVADFARPIPGERRHPRGVAGDRQPAVCLPLFGRGLRAAHPGGPNPARAERVRGAGVSPGRERVGD